MRARMSKRAAAEGRIDDKVDIHKKRYEDFVEQSEPIIEFYLARGLYEKVWERSRTWKKFLWPRTDRLWTKNGWSASWHSSPCSGKVVSTGELMTTDHEQPLVAEQEAPAA